MITSRTPLRISFAGGGTDLKAYYEEEKGAVFSTAIDKYVYINANYKFDGGIRLKYSKTEEAGDVNSVEHPLFRETMKLSGVVDDVEITSIADIPAKKSGGSGLGSSSSFTVGLLNALYKYRGIKADSEKLAEEASHIEIDILGEPIGKQDQYAASYGGLNLIEFYPDNNVKIKPVNCNSKVKNELENNTLLFYTGITRKSGTILGEQKRNTKQKDKFTHLTKMRDLAYELSGSVSNGSLGEFGELLHKGWEYKKKLASGITNPTIDKLYEKARGAGALGGKITGAGGGGFLMLYCEKEKQDKVRKTLNDLKELKFKFEPRGSEIILEEGTNGY